MSRPLIRSGQWSQTTTGITQPAARLTARFPTASAHSGFKMRTRVNPLFLLGIVFWTGSLTGQDTLFFENVSVFDGQRKIDPTNVLVEAGKIKAIGTEVRPTEQARKIDGKGKTLLPGMIDSHTHVWMESQLKQAAVFGVTTELDMMSIPENVAVFRKQQLDGKANDRADVFSAGAAVTVAGGHGTQFGFAVPTVDGAANAAQFVNERIREGSDYIKLILEDGSAYGRKIPTLDRETFSIAIRTAHEKHKLAVAHVSTQANASLALENDIDGLVHLFSDQNVAPEWIALAKTKKVFVVPTASVISNTTGANLSKMILEDEFLKPLISQECIANLTRTFPTGPGPEPGWKTLKENIGKLNQAGISILAGTDAANPGTDHGVSMHQELRMLVSAGLTNSQALAAATSNPAKHFKLADRGQIAPGFRADMILVEGDPTKDVANVARIVGVWKGGFPIDRKARIESVNAEQMAAKSSPKASANKLISNFEGDKVAADFGAGWASSTDTIMGGTSTTQLAIGAGGADGSKACMEVSGKVRTQQPAFAGAMFTPGAAEMQSADLSAYRKISFWIKGAGDDVQVMLFTQKRGFQPSIQSIKAGKVWKRFEFKFADFDGSDGSDILGFWLGKSEAGEFKFWIDQVQLEL